MYHRFPCASTKCLKQLAWRGVQTAIERRCQGLCGNDKPGGFFFDDFWFVAPPRTNETVVSTTHHWSPQTQFGKGVDLIPISCCRGVAWLYVFPSLQLLQELLLVSERSEATLDTRVRSCSRIYSLLLPVRTCIAHSAQSLAIDLYPNQPKILWKS